mmetsp:Transcript_74794/g.178535  ORF Transcript_74794/g.178535 Transcript_74794/m.178535 type:complete len:277 (+) Transcript_74794:1079-1909(+)
MCAEERGGVPVRLEGLVALASLSTLGNPETLTMVREFTDQASLFDALVPNEHLLVGQVFSELVVSLYPTLAHIDHRTRRNANDFVTAVCSAHAVAQANAPVLGGVVHSFAQLLQSVGHRSALQEYVATMATITAIWAHVGHVLLSMKGLAAVSSLAGLHEDLGHVPKSPTRLIPHSNALAVLATCLHECILHTLCELQLHVGRMQVRRIQFRGLCQVGAAAGTCWHFTSALRLAACQSKQADCGCGSTASYAGSRLAPCDVGCSRLGHGTGRTWSA